MIKYQHSVFALPFGLAGMLLAARGFPEIRVILWIVLASVFARSAAMGFNRWADADIDARNPRTAARAIPAGQLSSRFVLVFTAISALLFVMCAAMLNWLTLALSPVALLILLGYSYTKRFTLLSHFVLGLALGLAPAGAWIAVRGDLTLVPIMLSIAVILWTAGFDVIYSCQDYEVDRNEGLYSLPSRLGIQRALLVSSILHAGCVAALVFAGCFHGAGVWFYVGCAAVALLLCLENLLVDGRDMRRINIAFFTINSWVGVTVLAFVLADIYL